MFITKFHKVVLAKIEIIESSTISINCQTDDSYTQRTPQKINNSFATTHMHLNAV